MIEEFSGGYYRTKMTVQPIESGPSIERGLYDFIDREFYYQTDAPITMRLGFNTDVHVQPSAEGAMPTDVIGLPERLCDKMGVHPSAEKVNVFVLKPEHAYLFNQADNLTEQFLDSSKISDNTLSEADEDFFNLSEDTDTENRGAR